MRKHIYFMLMFFIIFFEGYIVAVINNYWIELLVLPIVCGGTAGWLYSKVLEECEKEAAIGTLEIIIKEIGTALNKEENNEQSKETME